MRNWTEDLGPLDEFQCSSLPSSCNPLPESSLAILHSIVRASTNNPFTSTRNTALMLNTSMHQPQSTAPSAQSHSIVATCALARKEQSQKAKAKKKEKTLVPPLALLDEAGAEPRGTSILPRAG